MPLSREGKERSFRENLILAHTLPGVAGMVNAVGYVQLGFYTSHVTGRASGFGINLAKEKFTDASYMLGLIVSFIIGAMLASALIELAKVKHMPRFAVPLFIEAVLLSVILLFEATSAIPVTELPVEKKIVFALALSTSMGLQNALVTRLSGAVIRTTHLTGLSTDLGIELVRVIRWYVDISKDKSLSERMRHLAELTKDAQLYRVRTYLTILFTFMGGCFLGTVLVYKLGVYALLAPIAVVLGLVVYDRVLAVSEEDLDENYNPKIAIDEARDAVRAEGGAAPAVPPPTPADAPR
jgi:uncharacterized membrane protein YoaK (UPF0700 family)